ncbi:MAG: hypothetical protein CL910_08340 [Deltaproteobacteria bacterium]|nr:hypothetical protein [Deltaproteobacteria bacterium]
MSDTHAAPEAPSLVSNELPGELQPLPGFGLGPVVDALLKAPAQVLYEIGAGGQVAAPLIAIIALCAALTGLVMATHAGGTQLLVVPWKITTGMLFGSVICLPSLHILTCLSGGTQTLWETAGTLLMAVAILGILLVGFAPVGFVFSQATSSPAFLGAMYLAFLGVSAYFATRLLRGALERLNGLPMAVVRVWAVVFLMVLCQLTTTLRPLIGPFEGWDLRERRFFLEHWSLELD